MLSRVRGSTTTILRVLPTEWTVPYCGILYGCIWATYINLIIIFIVFYCYFIIGFLLGLSLSYTTFFILFAILILFNLDLNF